MIYKIAFASSDGENVNVHFGQADRFYIAELDTEKEDYELTGSIEVSPSCHGGQHELLGFERAVKALDGVSAVVAQRAGPGAVKFIEENGIKVYQIPLTIEQALCLLLEEKQWEVDKWRSHLKN